MKRIGALILAAGMLLSMTGCNLAGDMRQHLQPPRLTGEQQAVQDTLDAYLAVGGQAKDSRLKYPKNGENRSAIWLTDMNGDGIDEAVAFYTVAQDETVHIHLMRRDEEENWQSVGDIVGNSTEIDEVALADLDGDGGKELLVGWTLYTSVDKQLTVYTDTETGLMPLVGNLLYTAFAVENLTNFSRDDLLIFRADTASSVVSVTLQAIENGTLKTVSEARLDGYIQGFTDIQLAPLSEDTMALYIDCYKDASTMLTELVFWNGEQLVAPFYNTNTNLSTARVRELSLTAADVNGDGTLEVPMCRRLPGYETATAAGSQWLIAWNTWTLSSSTRVEETTAFYCVMNMADGYYFRLDDQFVVTNEEGEPDVQVTALYNAAEREWSLNEFKNGKTGEQLLVIRAVETDVEPEEDADSKDTRKFVKVAESFEKNLVYEVWINEKATDLDIRKVTYQIVVW